VAGDAIGAAAARKLRLRVRSRALEPLGLQTVKLAGIVVQHPRGNFLAQGSRLVTQRSGKGSTPPAGTQKDPIRNPPGVGPVKQLGVRSKRG
jgi:hypothetical protein